MLSQQLIESALALTGKTMEDFGKWNDKALNSFFVIDNPKFCYYLLSPEFIEKYAEIINGEYYFVGQEKRMSATVGQEIYEYQSGNEKPLIELLSKICPTDQTM